MIKTQTMLKQTKLKKANKLTVSLVGLIPLGGLVGGIEFIFYCFFY